MASDTSTTWDVVVIGGGPAGENTAQYAIRDSDRTAVIVESELVGGECSYWACMPSKALLRPIEALSAVRSLSGAGAAVTGSLDIAAVLDRRDRFTSHHDDTSQVAWASGAGIDVVRGRGRLAGRNAVTVTAADGSIRTLHARHAVVVATGTTAAVPPVPGLRRALPWTSRDVTNLHEVPRRVAIVGGGVVACESATWLHGLGSEEVTVIERGPRLLHRQEPFAVETVEYDLGSVAGAALARDGYTGRAKLVIDRSSDTLVGATFVGDGVAELLHSATVAIVGNVTLEALWHAVPSYPTVSEVWLRLLEARR